MRSLDLSFISDVYTWKDSATFFLRIFIACLCGGFIGIERTRRLKEAGIRTHVIVCFASALIMIISKYAFADLEVDGMASFLGTKGADPARIAAQAISGVSFLGAGIIFKNGNTIKGLTTAAGLWATSVIGLTIGAGMIRVGVFATVIIMIIQLLMHRFTFGGDSLNTYSVEVEVGKINNFSEKLEGYAKKTNSQCNDFSIQKKDDKYVCAFTLRTKKEVALKDISELILADPDVIYINTQQMS